MNPLAKDPSFLLAVHGVCKRLGIPDCRMLLAVFEFESGTDPQCVNRIGATGLIQFLPSTARGLGTTTAQLATMTGVEQLPWVERYLFPYSGKLKTLPDLYMAVLWPRAIGQNDSYALWVRGSNSYRLNPLDANEDGLITKGEATARVMAIYARICKDLPWAALAVS